MQQIDEIRRMSELAKQMRELGLAKSNSDAFEQARSVTSSDPAVAAQRKQEDIQARLALLERKHEAQTRQIEELQSQLGSSNTKLADVLQKLGALTAKLRDLEVSAHTSPIPPVTPQWQPPAQQAWQQPIPQPAQTASAAPTWNQAYPPQQRVETRPPSAAPIDRNGVAPSEVSVEKFFYFGNRK